MRRIVLAAFIAAVPFAHAFADADDAAWISRCISDNAKEGQTNETLTTYCTCMNNKMSSKETLSITAWEKTHPNEQEACSKESKWQSK